MPHSKTTAINFSSITSLNSWLHKNKYHQSEENRAILSGLETEMRAYFHKKEEESLSWLELDEYYNMYQESFEDLDEI